MLRTESTMKKFEIMINTVDDELADELIASDATFFTPAFKEPQYGGRGYLRLVHWLRKSFSDIQWKLDDMVSEENKTAVRWSCTGTNDGEFMGNPPTLRKFTSCFMNFYYFNKDGKITNDIAAEGMFKMLADLGFLIDELRR